MLEQDDPKKCTSARLVKFGLAEPVYRVSRIPKSMMVLNPFSSKTLSPEDKESVFKGLVAVDCSWKRVQTVFSRKLPGVHRRLPTLLAANPVNYGARAMLSSAEALSAALYIIGFTKQAEELLRKFKWGETFLSLNLSPLEDYKRCSSEAEVLEVERVYFP